MFFNRLMGFGLVFFHPKKTKFYGDILFLWIIAQNMYFFNIFIEFPHWKKELILEYSGLKMKEKTCFEHSGFKSFSSAEENTWHIRHPASLVLYVNSVRNSEMKYCTDSGWNRSIMRFQKKTLFCCHHKTLGKDSFENLILGLWVMSLAGVQSVKQWTEGF